MQRNLHANGVITYTFDTFPAHNALLDHNALSASEFPPYPLQAHITTRHGGVSPAPWNTLNFSITRGDSAERVAANRQLLCEALEIDAARLVRAKQVHGTGIARVDASQSGQWMESSDGLITDTTHLPLLLTFADCTPVLLYDPVQHGLGVCHAGWRGTVNGAATATLWAMQAAFDTNPADVLVGIGPSIGPQSYEVGDEVIALAYAKLENAEQFFTYPQGTGQKPHFDLWQANASQLVAAGIQPQHIEISGIDTASNTHDFFSHRAERGQCGLFVMVVWLL